MTLIEILTQIESGTKPILTINRSPAFTVRYKECALSTAYYKDHFYFTLTKKTPQEALSGCTTINFLGLEKSQVEPFVGFLITMINELES